METALPEEGSAVAVSTLGELLSDESWAAINDTVQYLDWKQGRSDLTPDDAISYLQSCANYVRSAHAD